MDQEKRSVSIDAVAFDLESIMNFIFQNKVKDKSSEIREVWDKNNEGTLEMVQKSLAEVKSDNLGTMANIRYDLIKTLIEQVSSISMISESNIDDDGDVNLEDDELFAGSPLITELGQMLAINTLQKEGMLINLDSKKIEDE